jgi:hypothetical protein
MIHIQPTTWIEFKSTLHNKRLLWQYSEKLNHYQIFAQDKMVTYEYNMSKVEPASEEQVDFETNYKPICNSSLEPLATTDHRQIVKVNSRPLGTSGYFTSRDDDITNPVDVGNGLNIVELDHKIGDPEIQEITQRFNVEGNRSWIFEGYLKYSGAAFDRFCFYISTVATPYTESSGTNFARYPSKGIIIPAAGNGDVDIDTDNLTTLVSVVPKTDTGTYPAAFWDADFDSTTGKYGNLTPNPTGTGKYNIFYTEVVLKRYINNLGLLESGFFKFETSDPSELASNLKCNYRFTTSGTDHDWKAIIFISMFREKLM